HSTEKLQWGENLCFKVGGKIFCILNLGSVPPSVCFKCAPEQFAELTEREGIVPAPYLGRYKWILIQDLNVLSAHDLQDLIRDSYDMVVVNAKVATMKNRKSKSSRSRSR